VHVVVPLKRKRTVTECLDFSRAVSEAIAKADPRTMCDSSAETTMSSSANTA
jgi:hypothetical protein